MLKLLFMGLLASVLPIAAAHPGEDVTAEALLRRQFLERTPNLRKRCAPSLKARGHIDKSVARRRDLAQSLRASRGLPVSKPYTKRSLVSVLETDHNRTLDYQNVTIETPQDSFFTDNSSCVLWPHVVLPEGPYYVEGELIRSNAIEDLIGVYMMLDLQLIDVETCEPVKNEYVEFWQANHTGVYSGTVGNDNGNPDDQSNLNNTWLHAVQPTDEEGVVQIETLFPGHYAPRATHTHLLVHQGATVLPNNTLAGGNVSHIGQVFFDQDLIYEVDTIYPYTLNPNAVKLNAQDMVLIAEAEVADPIVNYVYLGDTLADGILGWVTVGINASAVFDVQNAAWWTANGGVENPDQPQAGPGGGGGGGGSGPGGPRPPQV